MSKLVRGKGFNDKTRPVFVDGKNVKEYALWQSMLIRCFSEKLQTHKPTYKGCNVSDNFLNYSYFYDWCQEQAGLVRLMIKDVVGVWIRICYLLVTKHILKALAFSYHKR